MSNIDKQALRGLSVESPFYLAECCNCGEIMPSSKLRESRNYPDDDGECHCPHCNADDCDIADSGAVGSEGVTAWNYQQKRIEALLDELEAKDRMVAELLYIISRHTVELGWGEKPITLAELIISREGSGSDALDAISAAAAGKGEAS